MNEKKVHSMKKYFVFGGIGLGVLFSIILVMSFFFSPKRRVMSAIKNTYGNSALSKGTLLDEISTVSGLMAKVGENGGTTDIDIKVKSPSSDGTLELSVNDTIDKNEKKMSGDAELISDGTSVLKVNYAGDDEKTYLSVDDLTDGYLEFDNDNFSEKFNDSALASSLGELQNYNIERFKTKGEGTPEKQQGGNAFEIVEKLFKNAKVKSAGTGKITVDGSEVRCKKYVATIKKSDVNKTLEMMSKSKEGQQSSGQERPSSAIGLISQLLQNQAGQQGGQQNSQQQMPGGQSQFGGQQQMPSGQGQFGGQQQPGQQGGQQGQEQQKPGLQGLMQAGVDQDVELTVYISKNQVRGFSVDLSIADDADTEVKIASKNTGRKVATASTDWKIAISSTQSDSELQFSIDQEDSDKADIEAEISLDNDSTAASFSGDLDIKDNGESAVLDIDELTVSKSGSQILSASGSIGLSTDTEDIQSVDSDEKVVKAFSDSDSEVEKAIGADDGSLDEKIQDILEALSKLRSQPSGGSIAGNQPGGQQQTPGGQQQMPGGQNGSGNDQYGMFGGFGGYGGYGNFGGFGFGGGMGPGMGGPGMGPGMNPYTSYGDEDYNGTSDDLSEWEGSLSDSDYSSY